MEQEYNTKDLYGGAITCNIPSSFIDVSQFRQVPDNQEVYADPKTDQCIIFEIFEYEDKVPDNQSALYFFNEIASANECSPGDVHILLQEMLSKEHLPYFGDEYPKNGLIGKQNVSKFKEESGAKNEVQIILCSLRLPTVQSDIVITVNIPLDISSSSSSYGCFTPGNVENIGTSMMQTIMKSFQIKNWELFGEES